MYHHLLELHQSLDLDEKRLISFRPKDMVIKCELGLVQGQDMCQAYLNETSVMHDPKSGICFSLNFNESMRSLNKYNKLFESTYSGPLLGLHLDMDVGVRYYSLVQPFSQGLRLYVHSPNEVTQITAPMYYR